MKLSDFHFGGEQFGHSYSNEKIQLVVHHHWWHLFRLAGGPVLLFILPLIIVPIIAASASQASQLGPIVVFLGALWSLFFWHKIFDAWTDYYFDVWIITNWRIVDIELKSLFNLNVGSMLDLDHIQEIIAETRGIIQNVLGFGSLQIQTAATSRGEFVYKDVSNPAAIENAIRRAQVELEHTKSVTRSQLEHGL